MKSLEQPYAEMQQDQEPRCLAILFEKSRLSPVILYLPENMKRCMLIKR